MKDLKRLFLFINFLVCALTSFGNTHPKTIHSTYASAQKEGLIGTSEELPIDNPSDNIFHVNIQAQLNAADRVWLVYELDGVEDHTGVSRSINDQLSVGGYLVKQRKGFSVQRELVNPLWLKNGDNVVRFTLPDEASHSFRIRNLKFEVEKGVLKNARRCIINQPSLSYYDDKAYIKGFIQGEHFNNARVVVQGVEGRFFNGEFEAIIDSKAFQESCTAEIQVIFADGETLCAQVAFAEFQSSDFQFSLNTITSRSEKMFEAKKPNILALNGAKVVTEQNGIRTNTLLSITTLRDVDIAALDAGMVNVTAGHAGFRFLPHGMVFKHAASITLPFDESKIPEGYTAQDIRTFYFDEKSHHWVPLSLDSVRSDSKEVNSWTVHFTDMINGIIKVPESPEVEGYSATSIKGIKAANPTAAVNLISPPQANNTGAASLGYPITIPAGRSGIQPQIAIGYNSSASNGWLGIGWNLGLPAITLDTRWGVPRFDPQYETETYVINGEQLTPLAHRGNLQPRYADGKQFHPRVEGAFQKIVRHGSSPAEYWWEVTDKNGTRYFYGATASGFDANAVLRDNEKDNAGNIAHWCLREVRDINGNTLKYHYIKQEDVGIANGTQPGYQIYIDKISYTGFNGEDGPYWVIFKRDRQLNLARRKDIIINGNLGFKQVTADLLKRIEVKFGENKSIRSYELNYKEGEFYKTLLESISEFDAAGKIFNTHTFSYYNEVAEASKLFGGEETWNPGNDDVTGSMITNISGFTDEATALSGTKSSDLSVGVTVSVGLGGNVASKLNSVGGSFGYSQSKSEGVLSMIDMNGDGLQDKLFVQGGQLVYRPNLSGPSIQQMFGDTIHIKGMDLFHKEKNKTVNFGVEANALSAIMAGGSAARSTSKTTIYFTEANGDQLTDIVKNGTVYFNHIDPATGRIRFTQFSSGTPSEISSGENMSDDLIDREAEELERQQAIDQNPLHDIVRMWRAPVDGTVNITAPVRLIQSNHPDASEVPADGVRVSIQIRNQEVWSQVIEANDHGEHNPSNVSNISVTKGDRIYFRVGSRDNGSLDSVAWSPVIQYQGKDLTEIDANRKKFYEYRASEDFVLSGNQNINPPINGTVKITGDFVKPVTTDDVDVYVFRSVNDAIQKDTIWRKHFRWDEEVSLSLDTANIKVKENEQYYFQIVSSTNVNWSAIQWKPEMKYTAADDPSVDVIQNPIQVIAVPFHSMYAYPASMDKGFAVELGNDQSKDTLQVVPRLKFNTPPPFAPPFTGKITFSVKKLDTLVARRTLRIVNGKIASSDTTINVAVNKNDKLFIEYHCSDLYLAAGLSSYKALVNADNDTLITTGLYTTLPKNGDRSEDVIFGHLYRGWGHFAWNGNRDWSTVEIDESLLKPSDQIKNKSDNKPDVDGLANSDDGRNISGDDTYDASKDRFIVLVASGNDARYNGYDPYVNLDAGFMSSSRMGEDDLSPLTFSAGEGGGARAIDKISKSTSLSYTLGVSAGVSATKSGSESWSSVLTDYIDMNGDRYPDIVSEKKIQYTHATGGLSNRTLSVEKKIQKSQATTSGLSLAGSGGIPTAKFRRSAKDNPQPSVDAGDARSTKGSAKVTGNLSYSVVNGNDNAEYLWLDINGDGLPDKIDQTNRTVALNIGYGFLPPEPWNFTNVQKGESSTKTGGAGLGVSKGNDSFSVGFSLARSENWTTSALIDVNGDGLPDIVNLGNPIMVNLNLGGTFAAEPTPWTGAGIIGENETASESGNLSFTVGFTILTVKFTVTPSVSAGNSMSREKKKLSDIDGDGYADLIVSNKDNHLLVHRSVIGRTNLLKQVSRPMGASFTLSYARKGNTYEMPNTIWTLDSVRLFDGFVSDGVDYQLNSFSYEGGFYDRNERDFFGFSKVITRTHDTSKKQNPVYTQLVQTFANSSYYEKGLLLNESMQDGNGNKYTEKQNVYKFINPDTNTELSVAEKQSDDGNAFPALTETFQKFYEGEQDPGKETHMTYGYDDKGNITSYTDFGDESADDDVSAAITYHRLDGPYIMSTPASVRVTSGDILYRKRETSINENTGDVIQIRQFVSDDIFATYDMEFDAYGNLKKLTRPENHKGQRMVFEYEYDPEVNTYVTKATNSYGHFSEKEYDYRFGQTILSKDMNGNEIKYELDDVGRIKSVTGPYEKGGANKTIEFEYHPFDDIPWALSRNFDPADPKNKLQTVIFVDGLGRVLQTKKDIAVFAGDGQPDQEVMSVSGRTILDAFGRTVKSYYPVTSSASTPSEFVSEPDSVEPTRTEYDVLGRTVKVTLADETSTQTAYGFATDNLGLLQFSTKTIDPNGNQTEQFTDVRGRLMAVKNLLDGNAVWTHFKYNAMDEQVESTDDLGHTTFTAYDMLGRRVMRKHPDAGTTTYNYDLTGNIRELVTANLATEGLAIEYVYDFERVSEVLYPKNPENNVRYTYGEPGSSDNRAGKVVLQEDATGAQEFFYGPLGEITKTIRTVVIPQHDEQTYVMEWQYDTWNRLVSMTHADGEKVTYNYNAGGLLHSMTGKKKNASYNYVTQLSYDKFEQRVFLHYGNGTKTTYNYEAKRRRLENMTARTSAKRAFMDNHYSYDNMNNILKLENKAPVPSANLMGGSSAYTFDYDDLYRLIYAEGSFKGANDAHTYTLSVDYNSVGGITRKDQHHERKGNIQKKTTYDLLYTYGPDQPHAPIHIGDQTFTYDANGNQTGWTSDISGQRRKILWDEENRIRAIYDNGALYHYVYDAAGDRVLKGQSTGQRIFVNGDWKAGSGQMGNYTVYVNPYLVLRSGGYTKHYYIEGQRIVSKLGGGWDNKGKGPLKAGDGKVDYAGKGQKIFDGIVKNLKFLGADGQILTAGKSGKIPPGQIKGTGGGSVTESFRYFYHPDHLGSTSYVTDASGEVFQHLEYFAFGETLVEEHSNTDRTPYLFNGKELDDETGLYYYGARYYDPKTSIWLTVDPLAEKYPGQSPYNYAGNNPVVFVDYDGRDYGVYVNHNSRSITFRSQQIGRKQDMASLNKAVNFWNNQSDKFVYVVGKGRSAVAYSVCFEVTASQDDGTPTQAAYSPHFYSKGDERAFNDNTGEVNSYNVLPDNDKRFAPYEKRVAGVNDGDKSFVKEGSKNDNTGAHEIGHGMGNSHKHGSLMKGEGSTGGVTNSHIEEMLARVGLGDPGSIGDLAKDGTAGTGTLHVEGQGIEGFKQGRVMTIQKFERWQARLARREARQQQRAAKRALNN